MDFTITIPDELVPGIIAVAYATGQEPEAVIAESAEAQARKVCQDMKVGPYYEGPIPPQFNADGTPYTPPEPPAPDPPVEEPPVGEP